MLRSTKWCSMSLFMTMLPGLVIADDVKMLKRPVSAQEMGKMLFAEPAAAPTMTPPPLEFAPVSSVPPRDTASPPMPTYSPKTAKKAASDVTIIKRPISAQELGKLLFESSSQ